MLTAKNIERQLNLFYCRSKLEFAIAVCSFIYFYMYFFRMLFSLLLLVLKFIEYFRWKTL